MEVGVADANPDIVNENLEHLYWYADTIPTRDTSDMPIIANNTTDTNNALDISGGLCWDNTLTQKIILESTIIKKLDANWEAGSNQGGLDSGTKAVNTWYHVFLIAKEDGTSDVLFSKSSTNPTMPANYIYKRRIGSIRTDGNGNIKPFYQDGDHFYWKYSPVKDITTTNQVANYTDLKLTVPPNTSAIIFGHLIAEISSSTAASALDLKSKKTGAWEHFLANQYGSAQSNYTEIPVDDESKIQYKFIITEESVIAYLYTKGWTDKRGKN